MNPLNPLETTRHSPMHVTIRDCLVDAWIAGDGDAASAQPAENSRTWVINVGGQEHRGPAVDLTRHASSDAVKDMLRHWAKEHSNLFD